MKGYAGKLLHVNLSKQESRDEALREQEARRFIGGSGLAAKRLWEMTDNQTDPLGPENVLIFMTGPLTGTKVPLSGRHEVAAKSPLTGIFGESDVGGRWGTELKRAGFDGVRKAVRSVAPALEEDEVKGHGTKDFICTHDHLRPLCYDD